MACLPHDPRDDLFIKLHPENIRGLTYNEMLRMNLLDYILHSTCAHSTDTRDISYCLGGTITRQLIQCMLMPIKEPNQEVKFKKLSRIFEGFDKGNQ